MATMTTTPTNRTYTDACKLRGNLTALAGVKFAESLPKRTPVANPDVAALELSLARASQAYGAFQRGPRELIAR